MPRLPNWLRIISFAAWLLFQALQVLEFLTKRGSDHCIAFAKDDIQDCLKNLRHFDYVGTDGRDYGVNVRIRYTYQAFTQGYFNMHVQAGPHI